MSEADAEQWQATFEEVTTQLDRVGKTRGITGSVGEDDPVRIVTEHILETRVLTNEDDLGATAAQRAHLVQLDTVVEHDHAQATPRVLAAGEHHAAMQRRVEGLRERGPGLVARDHANQVFVAG